MEGSGLLPLLRRSWRLLLVAVVLSGAAGYFIASQATPVYEANTQLLTGPVTGGFDTLRASGELARTYAELAKTRPLLEEVSRELGLEGGAQALAPRVQVSASSVSRLVTIFAKDEDPRRAARIADAIGGELLERQQQEARERESLIDDLLRHREISEMPIGTRDLIRRAADAVIGAPVAGRLTLVNPAEVPRESAGLGTSFLTGLAAIGGGLFAMVLVVARDVLRDTVDTEERLTDVAPFPYLGSLPGKYHRKASVWLDLVKRSSAGDGYRLLATKLGLYSDPPRVSCLVVVTADDGPNTSALVTGLGAAVAGAGIPVTLVDADTTAAGMTRFFASQTEPGWSDLVTGDGKVDESSVTKVRKAVAPDLDFVPAGTTEVTSVEQGEIASLVEAARGSGRHVVLVAAPPVNRSAITVAWIEACEGSLLAVARHRTPSPAVADASQALSRIRATVAGVVLVDARRRLRRRRGAVRRRPPAQRPATSGGSSAAGH